MWKGIAEPVMEHESFGTPNAMIIVVLETAACAHPADISIFSSMAVEPKKWLEPHWRLLK
jgi:hypothetical protein